MKAVGTATGAGTTWPGRSWNQAGGTKQPPPQEEAQDQPILAEVPALQQGVRKPPGACRCPPLGLPLYQPPQAPCGPAALGPRGAWPLWGPGPPRFLSACVPVAWVQGQGLQLWADRAGRPETPGGRQRPPAKGHRQPSEAGRGRRASLAPRRELGPVTSSSQSSGLW